MHLYTLRLIAVEQSATLKAFNSARYGVIWEKLSQFAGSEGNQHADNPFGSFSKRIRYRVKSRSFSSRYRLIRWKRCDLDHPFCREACQHCCLARQHSAWPPDGNLLVDFNQRHPVDRAEPRSESDELFLCESKQRSASDSNCDALVLLYVPKQGHLTERDDVRSATLEVSNQRR